MSGALAGGRRRGPRAAACGAGPQLRAGARRRCLPGDRHPLLPRRGGRPDRGRPHRHAAPVDGRQHPRALRPLFRQRRVPAAPVWGSRGCAGSARHRGAAAGRRRRRAPRRRRPGGRPRAGRSDRSTGPPGRRGPPCSTSVGGRSCCASSAAGTPTTTWWSRWRRRGRRSCSSATWWSRAPPAFEDAWPEAVAGDARPAARAGPRPGRARARRGGGRATVGGAQREELLAVLAAVRAGRLDDGPTTPPRCTRRPGVSGDAADHGEREHAEQAGDRPPRPGGDERRTGSFSIAAVSASTPVSRSTVNGPRRPTLMSAAM